MIEIHHLGMDGILDIEEIMVMGVEFLTFMLRMLQGKRE